MKLYTEEQVRESYQSGFRLAMETDGGLKEGQQEFINSITPIELPSDEEIKDKSFNKFTQSNARTCFEEGAKWMKSKILGNNHLGGITY